VFRLPLWFVQIIGALLVLNPPVTALIGFDRYTNEMLALVAIVIYLLPALISVFYYRTRNMPPLFAWINLLVVAIVPQLVHQSIDIARVDSQTSWYVTGLGALLAVTAIRGQQALSWIGASILSLEVLIWEGTDTLFNSGLAGALSLVFAANALAFALARIEAETQTYLDKAIEIEAAAAVESATRAERSRRLAETLKISYPLLQNIAAGQLDEKTKHEAKLLEAELRDGIRGREIIDARLKAAIRSARLRGVEVVVLDEGGLTSLPESAKSDIRQKFAAQLDQISAGRVTMRAPRGGRNSATFVASRPGTAQPDVFLKL
jgi:uncharacterized membrane protein